MSYCSVNFCDTDIAIFTNHDWCDPNTRNFIPAAIVFMSCPSLSGFPTPLTPFHNDPTLDASKVAFFDAISPNEIFVSGETKDWSNALQTITIESSECNLGTTDVVGAIWTTQFLYGYNGGDDYGATLGAINGYFPATGGNEGGKYAEEYDYARLAKKGKRYAIFWVNCEGELFAATDRSLVLRFLSARVQNFQRPTLGTAPNRYNAAQIDIVFNSADPMAEGIMPILNLNDHPTSAFAARVLQAIGK